jgi:hypothetical protein
MKRVLFGLVFLLLTISLPLSARSTGMQSIDSDYHIWGNIAGTLYTYPKDGGGNPDDYFSKEIIFSTYDVRSKIPIERNLEYGRSPTYDDNGNFLGYNGPPPVFAESRTNLFSIYAESGSHHSSWFDDDYRYEFAAGYDGGSGKFPLYPEQTPNDAFAEASWIFKPNGTHMNLSYDFHPDLSWGFPELWLTDLTTQIELLYLKPYRFLVGEKGFNVDPTHEYELRMYTYTESAGDSISSGAKASIQVPEPATIFLLGFGLIGIAAFGRKKFIQ